MSRATSLKWLIMAILKKSKYQQVSVPQLETSLTKEKIFANHTICKLSRQELLMSGVIKSKIGTN